MMTDSPVGLHEFNRVVRITLLVPVTVLALLAGLLVWQVEQALDLRQHSIVDSRVIDQVLDAAAARHRSGDRPARLPADRPALRPRPLQQLAAGH